MLLKHGCWTSSEECLLPGRPPVPTNWGNRSPSLFSYVIVSSTLWPIAKSPKSSSSVSSKSTAKSELTPTILLVSWVCFWNSFGFVTSSSYRFYCFIDVVSIEKTGELFRLIYDVKGRFTIHRITPEEAKVCFLIFQWIHVDG